MLKKSSPEHKQLKARYEQDAKEIKDISNTDRYLNKLKKLNDVAQQDLAEFEANIAAFLEAAVLHYCRSLLSGDDFDKTSVYRLISLWFAHSLVDVANPEAAGNSKRLPINSLLASIPSRKFVPLVRQIGSRLAKPRREISENERIFRTDVNNLFFKMATEHTEEVFFPFFTLTSSSSDSVPLDANTSLSNVDRTEVANEMFTKLKAMKPLVLILEKLVQAYISVGKIPKDKDSDKNETIAIDKTALGEANLPASVLQQLSIPTCRGGIKFSKFEKQISWASTGISRPKFISIEGSDGNIYKQVLKTGSDQRQDCILGQVFELVNDLMHSEPRARHRNLRMRTYIVFPLTRDIGICEFVLGSSSLYDTLVAIPALNTPGGLHHRYSSAKADGKGGKYPLEANKRMKECKDMKQKEREFNSIINSFQPVFHHWFREMFPNPQEWFEKRLAYTRSVAVSSIVAYMLGLGDRHLSNIFIDTSTAELVHIDLEMCFDFGKTLSSPEVVPFRLTRELVDGMGVCGFEGTFKRCCEETARLLRANEEMLLTVLEVLVHDPLWTWILSAAKMNKLRDQTALVPSAAASTTSISSRDLNKTREGGDSQAQSVIFGVKQKLRGTEKGV